MNDKIRLMVLPATLVLVFLAGCGGDGASGGKNSIEVVYNRPPEVEVPERVKKIAIAPFTGQTQREVRYGDVASDKLAGSLHEYNQKFQRYQLVDRKRVAQVLAEQDMQKAISDSGTAVQAGKIANVDAIIFGDVKIDSQRIPATRRVPDPGSRSYFRTEHYTKLKVTAIISFTMTDVQTTSMLATHTSTCTFDSDKQNKGTGFARIVGMMGGSDEETPVIEAANLLIDQCVQQFVAQISPHEQKMAVKLEKGKTKAVSQGNKLAQSGDFQGAIDMYQEGLEEEPRDDGAKFNIGLMYEAMQDYPNARKYYDEAYRLNSDKESYVKARSRVSVHLKATAPPAPAADPKPSVEE